MSITWNGVSSDTIGVIVERIPNRYVPTRRFSPQQVAGRNGNILLVDKSFPNVEQEYEVYLSAESQGLPSVARACAEWLMGPDGYCRLQDSYDTTVYREAFLMGGYDLENILNKFGRCTITFSCKPQKYLLTGDTPISIPAGTTTTYTGSSVQFDGITGASITSLSTTLSPIQDLHGYSHPWPGGGGKNLCSVSEHPENPRIFWGTDWAALKSVLNSLPAGQYTISMKYKVVTVPSNNIVRYSRPIISAMVNESQETLLIANYIDDTSPTVGGVYEVSGTFTLASEDVGNINHAYLYCDSSVHSGDGRGTYNLYDVQIELGSTVTAFEPYENICPITGRTGVSVYVSPTQDPDDATTYSVDWSTQAGTVYGGSLDVVTGVLTVDYVKKTVTSVTLWNSSNPNGTPVYAGFSGTDHTLAGIDAAMMKSNIFTYSSNGRASAPLYAYGGNDGGVTTQTFILPSSITTKAEADAWFAANPTECIFKLATPLTYQLTPHGIGVLVGENNVWSSSGPVSVTVVTPLGGIVTNPTPFEARPMLEVSGVGEITINGKSIQILESVSDFQIDCETMEAEDNSKIYCMDFPDLSGGENEIVGDGSITALTVTPRWWTL